MVSNLFLAVTIVLLSAGLLPGSVVRAEDSAIENTDVLDELSLSNLLNMEITTGSFLDLDLQKSPLSMTIISDEMIRSSGARHVRTAGNLCTRIYLQLQQMERNSLGNARCGQRPQH